MSDEVVEVTEQGWLSRIMDSIKGVLVGLLLFVIAFPLLWWNEGRAVQTYKSLKEGLGAVVEVVSDKVDKGNEKKLVHMSGLATTDETLKDSTFLIDAKAIRLERDVEMYQWVEKVKTKKKKKVGGKEETVKTYSYATEWKSSPVDSSSFKKPKGHSNPGDFPYDAETWTAGTVTLGAFNLSPGLKGSITKSVEVPFTEEQYGKLPRMLKKKSQVHGKMLYIGDDPADPKVGDVKVTFAKVPPADVSIIAQQIGDTFQPYQTEAGDKLEMLNMGTVGSKLMFAKAEEANVMMTWILRLVGFILMLIGLGMIFKPIAVVADVVPLVGDILRMGFGLVSFAIALPLTLLTIALAWLFYRPVLSIILLVVAVGIIVGIKMLASKRKAAAAPAPAPAAPAAE